MWTGSESAWLLLLNETVFPSPTGQGGAGEAGWYRLADGGRLVRERHLVGDLQVVERLADLAGRPDDRHVYVDVELLLGERHRPHRLAADRLQVGHVDGELLRLGRLELDQFVLELAQ